MFCMRFELALYLLFRKETDSEILKVSNALPPRLTYAEIVLYVLVAIVLF
jgi:hypothetical protein